MKALTHAKTMFVSANPYVMSEYSTIYCTLRKNHALFKSTRKSQRWCNKLVRADPHMEHEEWLPPCPVLRASL